MGIRVLADFGLYMRLYPVVQPTNGEDTLASAVVAVRQSVHPVNMKYIMLLHTVLPYSFNSNYHISEILLWRKVQCLYRYIILLEALM